MFDVNFSAASNRLSQLLAAQPEGLRVLTDDIIHTVFTDPQINPFIQLIRDPANLVTDFEGVTHLRIPISVGTVGTGPSNA
jgi:hypothetical protein